ncbi:MAG TPA: glycosyltransferase family 39 protein, partial [Longimicrobiales bacterium]
MALGVIALATLARLVAGASIGLSVDESYAVSVARRLTLSYFDHPPLSFWLPTVVARLTGSKAAIVLRLPFIALFAGTSWLMFRLTARLFGERAGLLAVLLLSVSPVFTFSTGGWVLPDGPLMFCMLAAALCLERVLLPGDAAAAGSPAIAGSAGNAGSGTGDVATSGSALIASHAASAWRWWLGAGLFTGLAMLSKYHGVFVAFGAFLYILTRRDARGWLRRPQPYVAVALALLIFSPALIWNVQHDWVSLRFQG